MAAPRGSGYDYIQGYDFIGEAGKAADQAREKLKAKSIDPGKYDLVLDPTHLWLTIHESVGHPTEHAHLAAAAMTTGRLAKFFWPGLIGAAVAVGAPWIGPVAIPFALLGLLAYEHAYVQAGQSVPLA